MIYCPDKWHFVDTGICVKVFATWLGGYVHGDEWRLNSGCTKIIEESDCYVVYGHSGSVYELAKGYEGTSAWSSSVLHEFIRKNENFVIISPEEAMELVEKYGVNNDNS